jgi:translation elongation factor EF-Tu-like GTPase
MSNIWIIGQDGHGKTTLTAAIARCAQRHCIDGASACPEGTQAAILVVSAADGPMPQTRDQLKLAKQAGVPRVVVFMNKIDAADKDLTDLVEMELRELLNICGYDGAKAAVVRGSASKALEGGESEIGAPAILRLMNAVDGGSSAVPHPVVEVSEGLGGLFRRFFS